MDSNHLKGGNLPQRVYKTPLTTKSHEQEKKMNLLSFVIILSVYSEKFIIGRNHHCCLTIVSHYTYRLSIFNSFEQFIKLFFPLFHGKDFHSWFIYEETYEETARSAYSIWSSSRFFVTYFSTFINSSILSHSTNFSSP